MLDTAVKFLARGKHSSLSKLKLFFPSAIDVKIMSRLLSLCAAATGQHDKTVVTFFSSDDYKHSSLFQKRSQ